MAGPQEGRTSTGAAFIAAALSLASVPLAFAAFALFLDDELKPGRTILVVWGDNPVALTLVAGAALLAGLGSALLVFRGVQRQGPALLAVVPLAGLVAVVAAGAAMRSVSQALAGCSMNPSDAPLFAVLVFVDGQLISAAGLTFASALLMTSTLGVLVAAVGARTSRVLWTGSALLGAGALVCLVGVARLWRLVMALRRSTRGTMPELVDGLVRDTGALEDHRSVLLVTLALLALAIVSGALALRETPRVAVLLVLFGVSATLPVGSLVFVTASSTSAIRRAFPAAPFVELVTLDGAAATAPGQLLRRTASDAMSLAQLAARVAEVSQIDRDLSSATNTLVERTVPLGIEATAELSDVLRIVDALAPQGARTLELIGVHETNVSHAAPELVPLLSHFKRSYRSVTVFIDPFAEPASGDTVATEPMTLPELLSAALSANRRGHSFSFPQSLVRRSRP